MEKACNRNKRSLFDKHLSTHHFNNFDSDGDGQISLNEAKLHLGVFDEAEFFKLDLDGDKMISPQEMDKDWTWMIYLLL